MHGEKTSETLSLALIVPPLLMKRELLNPHIADLADKQVVLAAAVDGIDGAKLFRQFPGLTELANNGPV